MPGKTPLFSQVFPFSKHRIRTEFPALRVSARTSLKFAGATHVLWTGCVYLESIPG